jgi:hypothetical protein
MNRRQKTILMHFTIVIVITAVAVVAMINFKDWVNRSEGMRAMKQLGQWVNRSEGMRAMKQLGQIVLKYRKEYGSIPPESYVDRIKESLEGHVRLGHLQYRAQWIKFESSTDEILAYTEKNYRSLLGKGFIVLRLDGRVEWMKKQEFQTLWPCRVDEKAGVSDPLSSAAKPNGN